MNKNGVWLVTVAACIAVAASLLWLVYHAYRPAPVSNFTVTPPPSDTPVPRPRPHRAWDHDLAVAGVRPGEARADVEAARGKPAPVPESDPKVMAEFTSEYDDVEIMWQDQKAAFLQGVELEQARHVLLKPGLQPDAVETILGPPDDSDRTGMGKWSSHPEIASTYLYYYSDKNSLWVRIGDKDGLLSVALVPTPPGAPMPTPAGRKP